MVQHALIKAGLLLAASTSTMAGPLNAGTDEHYDDLVYRFPLPDFQTQSEPVYPEIIPVPRDFVPDKDYFGNLTATQGPTVRRGIIGADDRFQWDGTEFPFKPIGRVTFVDNTGQGSLCSGALIGPRHVLTARHCIGDGSFNGRFAPSFLKGERFGSAGVVGAITDPDYANYPYLSECWIKNDYAILILDQRIGDQTGYLFLASNPDPATLGQPELNTCGYPGDKDGGGSKWCQYRRTPTRIGGCDSTGPVSTDIDAVGGQSGSVVWDQAADGSVWIWGVLSVSSATETVMASGSQMLLGWQFAMTNWP
ncbi:trypsin-like cysteine/serine peptidase domain-containing protein [Microdochium bolleyi]|uniref:Trypsin-like cysteine/serine peptidase domain-containing protein n=1 Tax=Microdochium bolleyi TaxID=196109 RepID=A0A136IZZ1_9PEZI|nr:trypsin-like cysteine/serine peptidase domain-containing protein [Microdochium bolleyi]